MNSNQIFSENSNKKVYRSGDFVMKAFDTAHSKADVLNEALNHVRVEEAGVSVPKLEEVSKIDGKPTIVMEYIDGKTMEQLMMENPDRVNELMGRFVEIQLAMHQFEVPRLNRLRGKMKRKIAKLDVSDAARYELDVRLAGMPKHQKLCHGDFNPTNVIIDKNDNPYIIDWSHASQGNASADAAITYLYFVLRNEESAELYLNTFCEKADIKREYVQSWFPIVAAAQLEKGIDGETEFLRKWIDIIEYQ